MSSKLYRNRFLISRRIVQIGILFLFWAGSHLGWKFLVGNLSAAHVFEKFYLADPYAALQMAAAGMLISADVIIGGLIVLLFYALLAGRSFCSWVCPLNIVTDFAHRLRRKYSFGKSGGVVRLNRKTRYWILGLSFIMSLILGVAAFEYVSPISLLHRGIIFGFGMGWLAIVLIFLFDLLVLKHGWCGHICPLGAFYSTVSKKSLLKVYHEKEKCTDCLDCKVVCPEIQVLKNINIKSGPIAFGACTNCGRCIEVCEEDALKYSLKI